MVGQDHGMAAVRLLPFWENFSGSGVIGSGPGIRSSVVDCQPPVSGRASEWRQSLSGNCSVGLDRTQWCRSRASFYALSDWRAGDVRRQLQYGNQHVNNRFSNGLESGKKHHFTSPGRGVLTNRRPSPSRPASPTPTHPLRCQPCWAARCPCSLPYPWRREAARARSFEARASSAPHRRPCPIR